MERWEWVGRWRDGNGWVGGEMWNGWVGGEMGMGG